MLSFCSNIRFQINDMYKFIQVFFSRRGIFLKKVQEGGSLFLQKKALVMRKKKKNREYTAVEICT